MSSPALLMTTFSKYDITKDGPNFIPEVEKDQSFKKDRYLYGKNGLIYWAAIDRIKFPLYVWEKPLTSTYVRTAWALDAAGFSNGPLMTTGKKPYGPVHSDQHNIDDKGGNNLDQWLYLFGRNRRVES
jgi:hypothetical protein